MTVHRNILLAIRLSSPVRAPDHARGTGDLKRHHPRRQSHGSSKELPIGACSPIRRLSTRGHRDSDGARFPGPCNSGASTRPCYSSRPSGQGSGGTHTILSSTSTASSKVHPPDGRARAKGSASTGAWPKGREPGFFITHKIAPPRWPTADKADRNMLLASRLGSHGLPR